MCLLVHVSTYFRGWREGEGEGWVALKLHVSFWGIFVGRFKCGKMGWPLKRGILYKKIHWSPNSLKGGTSGSTLGKKWAIPKKGILVEAIKSNVRMLFRTYWNLVYHLEGVFSETWGNAVWRRACANPVGLSMFDDPIETAEYIWWIFVGCLIGFCHKTVEIHFLFIQLIN